MQLDYSCLIELPMKFQRFHCDYTLCVQCVCVCVHPLFSQIFLGSRFALGYWEPGCSLVKEEAINSRGPLLSLPMSVSFAKGLPKSRDNIQGLCHILKNRTDCVQTDQIILCLYSVSYSYSSADDLIAWFHMSCIVFDDVIFRDLLFKTVQLLVWTLLLI